MRLIDVDALLQVPNMRKVTEYDETGEFITYLAVPVEAIQNAPTIEAEPVRHGRWKFEFEQAEARLYRCSECNLLEATFEKENIHEYFPYCHCGCKMDLEEEE